jgi:hypothetical protein
MEKQFVPTFNDESDLHSSEMTVQVLTPADTMSSSVIRINNLTTLYYW